MKQQNSTIRSRDYSTDVLSTGGTPSSAFTLIELLVVIAIIALLAAILFPVFARARAQARQTVCLSNMKQYGLGVAMYTQDYDEVLPGNSNPQVGRLGGAFNVALGFMTPYAPTANLANIVPRDIQPYVKNLNIFVCPETTPRAVDGKADPVTTAGGGNTSYLLNGVVLFRPLSKIISPTDTIFAHEESIYQREVQSAPQCTNGTDPFCAAKTYTSLDFPDRDNFHKSGGNMFFCDGHAKWQYKTQILYTEFGVIPDVAGKTMSLNSATALTEGAKTYAGAF